MATSDIEGAAASVEGMYPTTAEKYMTEVLTALLNLRHQHLHMPTNVQKIEETKMKFSEIAKFPNVIGAVDCTHLRLESTSTSDILLLKQDSKSKHTICSLKVSSK